jgi:hypothetical protein
MLKQYKVTEIEASFHGSGKSLFLPVFAAEARKARDRRGPSGMRCRGEAQ